MDREQEYLEGCWQDFKAVCAPEPYDEDLKAIHGWRVLRPLRDENGVKIHGH